MKSIFRGNLATREGRTLAWMDSLFIDHACFRLVWSNFAPVVPGRLYRSNHPTPGRLRRLTNRYGLKTLIDLRGDTGNGSDALSREAAHDLGLAVVDAPLRSRGAPDVAHVIRLMEIYRTMAEPALLHCKSGADRAGLASAIFLLTLGRSLSDAMAELSLHFGHFRRSKAGVLDAFLRAYQAAGDKPFTTWLVEDYDPAALDRGYVAHGFFSLLNDLVLARE